MQGERLKKGYTTGTCSAVATYGAAQILLSGTKLNGVAYTLPNGITKEFEIQTEEVTQNSVCCSIIKDAGDDPDVTNGIKIYATVSKIKEGFEVVGGLGIGTVTKKGLAVEVGKKAINPMPLAMIQKALTDNAQMYHYKEGLMVELTIPKGEEIAKKTFNERLGIVGGISILGTTGIVEPMSEDALIKTIRLEITSKKANGEEILFLAPGNYGIDFAKNVLNLNINKAVKCSNYIGEALDAATKEGFSKLLLVGHSGKLSKIAAGVMNTHSKNADCRNEVFCAHSAYLGASQKTAREILNANTTDEIYVILKNAGLLKEVYNCILSKIVYHIKCRCNINPEVIIFSKEYGVLAQTKNTAEYIAKLKEN